MLINFIIIFTFSLCVYDLSTKYKSMQMLTPFALLFFIIVICLRNPIEHDTKAYVAFYNKLIDTNYIPNERFEIGFQLLTALLKKISLGCFQIYFAYITLINLILLHFSTRNILRCFPNIKHVDYFLCEIFFLCYFGIFYNAITLRSSLSLSLSIFANSIYIKKRKIILPILIFIIASTIHKSAIFFGFGSLILFLFKPFKKNIFVLFWILTGFVYFGNLLGIVLINFIKSPTFTSILDSIHPALSKFFQYYINANYSNIYGIAKRYVLYYILELIFILKYDKQNEIYGKLLFVYVIGMFLMTGGRMIAQIERITDYFVAYQPFLLLLCVNNKKNIFHSYYMYYGCLFGIVFCQIMFAVNLFNMGLLPQFQ